VCAADATLRSIADAHENKLTERDISDAALEH